MSTKDKIAATAKNIEGKAQAAVGEMTGNPEQKAEGNLKQTEAKIEHETENLKDKAKKIID
ncbi:MULTISPECIES: CsbD family protein [unclassified Spirulina]|uniref:CsbD family protein n=1 Tax=unclassified Spirulina TaxID=2684457 RepID=UPI0019512FA6|nr:MULTISPECIES: CsbD family protein [Spirulina]MEA5469402.1 CsbD family protein [Spirulina sp. 06S082]